MGGSDEDDEDTHFCIKCHATMRGLENYVAHRKAKCRPEKEVEAVDFFSSLNLQSSSSKTPTGPGDWPPPPAHTGGKWKPGTIEEQHNEPREIPPPTHTGGKWKPPQAEHSETPRPAEVPPPDHTRGKWGPAERPWGQLRKGLYWCGPCNRRLSSRVVYDRHVRSELHFKRTNQWPGSEPQVGSRTRVRTKAILSSSLKVINRRYTKEKEMARKKKKKRGGPMVCEACGCKVWPHMMGKHLVSHYHVRHRRPGWEHLVLKNVEKIVKHFPFQCGLCKFYTNTVGEFSDHWTSHMHLENDHKLEGNYWCTICKWSCDNTISMGYHLNSKSHEQFVSVINRSVPVVIQKHISISCEVCSRRFRYNFQLRGHARAWGHTQVISSASDGYQEVIACKDCDYRCFSLISYQRHIRMKHGKEMHFCRKCDKRFATLEEAKKHRQEAKHREAGNNVTKRCLHCQAEFQGLAAIREHLTRDHPEERHRCPKCGAEFVLKQELSRHARTEGECRPDDRPSGTSGGGGSRNCGECGFSTDSEAELLLHGILHVGPDPATGRYHCPSCGRWFAKEALKNHARTHTRERTFVCRICQASFSRRDALAKHTDRLHDTGGSSRIRSQLSSTRQLSINLEQDRTKDFTCLQCSAAFYDKASLERHTQRHEGKKFPCDWEGCIFKGRSAAELRVHERTHSAAREFHCTECQYSAKTRGQLSKHIKSLHMERRRLDCPHCDFTTKNSTHLRRHINLHTGQKPYLCPHCPFSCTLLENLRKHVINSKLHPGKCLYECSQCDMKTNFSKEMKAHLVSKHGESPSVAAGHVAAIYRQEEEPPAGLVPVKPNRRKKKSEDEIEEDQLPTLSSVALNTHEEDVIFIEVDEDLEGVLYQSADPAFALEGYTPDRV